MAGCLPKSSAPPYRAPRGAYMVAVRLWEIDDD